MRETGILVEQQPSRGVLVCDHAGLVINEFSLNSLVQINLWKRPRKVQFLTVNFKKMDNQTGFWPCLNSVRPLSNLGPTPMNKQGSILLSVPREEVGQSLLGLCYQRGGDNISVLSAVISQGDMSDHSCYQLPADIADN